MCIGDQANILGSLIELTCKNWAVAGCFFNNAWVSRAEWVGFLKWNEVRLFNSSHINNICECEKLSDF